MAGNALHWRDPVKEIWGFHLHQELPLEVFPQALVIQKNCARYLAERGLRIEAASVFRPGYGPHLQYMWELRVEQQPRRLLQYLGLAASYLAVNRLGLSAYLHPLMHNPLVPDDLATEGRLNQANTLWFGYKVEQNQDFFFHPQRDGLGIVDTRTPCLLLPSEKDALLAEGERRLADAELRSPETVIVDGFRLQMDFDAEEEALALEVFDQFLAYLRPWGLRPTRTRIEGPGRGGWEVRFEPPGGAILEEIGVALAWLMCNRQGLSVFAACSESAMFIGDPPNSAPVNCRRPRSNVRVEIQEDARVGSSG